MAPPFAGRRARGLDVEDDVGGLVQRERAGVSGPQGSPLPEEPGSPSTSASTRAAGVAVRVGEGEELVQRSPPGSPARGPLTKP